MPHLGKLLSYVIVINYCQSFVSPKAASFTPCIFLSEDAAPILRAIGWEGDCCHCSDVHTRSRRGVHRWGVLSPFR